MPRTKKNQPHPRKMRNRTYRGQLKDLFPQHLERIDAAIDRMTEPSDSFKPDHWINKKRLAKRAEAKQRMRDHHIYSLDVNTGMAGLAHTRENWTDLHVRLFFTGWEHRLEATLFHELAHHLNTLLFKEDGHGAKWKYCCEELGLHQETRCHDYGSELLGVRGARAAASRSV